MRRGELVLPHHLAWRDFAVLGGGGQGGWAIAQAGGEALEGELCLSLRGCLDCLRAACARTYRGGFRV